MHSSLTCPLNASLFATFLNKGAHIGPPHHRPSLRYDLISLSESHFPWSHLPAGCFLTIHFHWNTLIVPQLKMMIPLLRIIVRILKINRYKALKLWCPSQNCPHYTTPVAVFITALIVFLPNAYMCMLTKFWSKEISSNRTDP